MTNASRIFDITVPGGPTWVDVFWLANCDNCYFDNLLVLLGSTTASFHIATGNVNACTFNNCGTVNAKCTYNFYCEDAGSYGTISANVFNAPCAQGGNTGFYIGYNCYDTTFNSIYTEKYSVPRGHWPIRRLSAYGITLNSPSLGAPDSTQTNYNQANSAHRHHCGLWLDDQFFIVRGFKGSGSAGIPHLLRRWSDKRRLRHSPRVNPQHGRHQLGCHHRSWRRLQQRAHHCCRHHRDRLGAQFWRHRWLAAS